MQMNWGAIRKLHDSLAQSAIAEFNSKGGLSPQLVLVQVSDEGDVQAVAPMPSTAVISFFRTASTKNALASFMREVFTEGSDVREALSALADIRPNLIIQINESWVLASSNHDRAKALFDEGKSIADAPERKEAIVFLLHTAEGTVTTMHMISDDPRRHCDQGAFPDAEALLAQLKTYSGRFSMQENMKPERDKHH